MSQPGTVENPLRVAVIGAGPAGFYTAEHLFKHKGSTVLVDMYERLPTPFGLVRGGVAPDHQKIKSVTKLYDRIAGRPEFRFFGNVEFGKDVTIEDLRRYYHQIVYTVGAQTDRRLNIEGIDAKRSHAATEFVAWYNGHPDYRDLEFDLSQEKVAVIGVGNVAMDVARILARTPEELAVTDIADHALEALRESQVKEIYILGRRGPLQAAFTAPEVKELGELADADALVKASEAMLDPLSKEDFADADKATVRKMNEIDGLVGKKPTEKSRKLTLRFLVSPTEVLVDESGGVSGLKLMKNELYRNDVGNLRPRATGEEEMLDVGLIFRSIGYHGVPLPGVPFDERKGVICNDRGRVVDAETRERVVGEYTAGWIKRGPSGVIGTNKSDAGETVDVMYEDIVNGAWNEPEDSSVAGAVALVKERQPRYVSYDDWLRLDALEIAAGDEQGRPRVKFTSVEEMLTALGK
ncbi:MAG TPA: FAD-dependent oxidoreductase [Anaerolineae bacterium]|nr:FAD-dependent oxidoreductase [Anaerolineae bacterium]